MSSPKSTPTREVNVYFSKKTGGAHADIREVIESELERIRNEKANRSRSHNPVSEIRNDDQNDNDQAS